MGTERGPEIIKRKRRMKKGEKESFRGGRGIKITENRERAKPEELLGLRGTPSVQTNSMDNTRRGPN